LGYVGNMSDPDPLSLDKEKRRYPDIPCPDFNSSHGCKQEICKWGHICMRCGDDHSLTKCPLIRREKPETEDTDAKTTKEERKEILKLVEAQPDLPLVLKNVLLAEDYFAVLELETPIKDELGSPFWDVKESEIKKAFRKMSLVTHPDKNPGVSLAARAFDAVKKAYQVLIDDGERFEYLKAYIEKENQLTPASWAPPPTSQDIEQALKKDVESVQKAQQLRTQHFKKYQDKLKEKISQRMKQTQARMKRKKKRRKGG